MDTQSGQVTTAAGSVPSPGDGCLLIFLAGSNFWEGLFDTVNYRFLKNLFQFRLATVSAVLMSVIRPPSLSLKKQCILAEKEARLKRLGRRHGVTVAFYHVHGRTLTNLVTASSRIAELAGRFDRRLIWAHNYYNCFLGVLVKARLPGTALHYDILGLAPEEELLYSESVAVARWSRFCVLKALGRVNIRRADSVSVVSHRFKTHVLATYSIAPEKVDVIPCYYDDETFFHDPRVRDRYRAAYRLAPDQKLILYSGMLQKWQLPERLFAFFKMLQQQDADRRLRFMVLTFDPDKARRYAASHRIEHLTIDSLSGADLNGAYNAADIGVALRSADIVSQVSSPVKIPEYLATRNSLILLESIGDFGAWLKGKEYCLVREDVDGLNDIRLDALMALKKPTDRDLADIARRYGPGCHVETIRRIFARHGCSRP